METNVKNINQMEPNAFVTKLNLIIASSSENERPAGGAIMWPPDDMGEPFFISFYFNRHARITERSLIYF